MISFSYFLHAALVCFVLLGIFFLFVIISYFFRARRLQKAAATGISIPQFPVIETKPKPHRKRFVRFATALNSPKKSSQHSLQTSEARVTTAMVTTNKSNGTAQTSVPISIDIVCDHQQPSTSTAPEPTTSSAQPSTSSSKKFNNRSQHFDRIRRDQPFIVFDRNTVIDINTALVELNADRTLFEVAPSVEMEGTFGEIIWANWRQIGATGTGLSGDIDDEEDDAKEDIALICKTLKHDADRIHFEKFLREALRLHNVPAHANLAQVMAAATFGNFLNPDSIKDLPLICYRHAGFGFLKKFLLICRRAVTGERELTDSDPNPLNIGVPSETTLRTHDLILIGSQLLSAMQHLHTFGVIHKDVATRNCLVSRLPAKFGNYRFHIQLCDYALSSDLFPDEYYPDSGATNSKGEREPQPIKWMAPESLTGNIYSSASDIWSFGVVLWELFTCGQNPWLEVHPENMALVLLSESRLPQPYNCPDEIYAIMSSCWTYDALKRPTTAELGNSLSDFSSQLRKYI